MLQRFKPLTVNTLLLDRSNDSLHQPVVAPEQKWHCHSAKRAITVDQGLLQGRLSRARLGRSLQVPAQDLAGVAIDHHGQTRPTISTRPNAAQVRGPTLVGRLGHGGHGLNTRPKPKRTITSLNSKFYSMVCSVYT
jgi:hypothetical protein